MSFFILIVLIRFGSRIRFSLLSYLLIFFACLQSMSGSSSLQFLFVFLELFRINVARNYEEWSTNQVAEHNSSRQDVPIDFRVVHLIASVISALDGAEGQRGYGACNCTHQIEHGDGEALILRWEHVVNLRVRWSIPHLSSEVGDIVGTDRAPEAGLDCIRDNDERR